MSCSRKSVLLVDDDDDLRESLGLLLEMRGYAVALATDGEDALEKIRAGLDPCLIVLDLMMPRMDGFQFREEQARDERLREIPVVVCSAVFDAEAVAEQLRVNHYLTKPIDLNALLGLIRHYCEGGGDGRGGSNQPGY